MLFLGAIAFGIGTVTLVVVEPLVHQLPSSFAIVAFAGFLAILSGLWIVRSRYKSGVQQTTIPNVEAILSTPAPGHETDRALRRLTHLREGTLQYREQIQERLTSAAVAVIMRREDCSEAQAIHQLEEGTWTDNETAAAFFSGGNPPKEPLTARLVNRFFGDNEDPYEGWVRITVDEITKLAEIEPATETDETDDASDTDTDDTGGFFERFTSKIDGEEDDITLLPASYKSPLEDDDAERKGNVASRRVLETNHWHGISAIALVGAGWGMLTFDPNVLLVSVVGVALAAYARSGSAPSVTALDVERQLSNESPQPGETVEVTVTVENTSDSFVPDLRLLDRVPGPMEVVDGSPRMATALNAGQTATFSYTVVAERGTHEWPLVVVARDFSGSVEREAAIDVESEMDCVPSLQTIADAPLRAQTSLFSGQMETSASGSGLEFFAMREYQEGDPMKRIDWKRYARTNELSTIDFRQERAAKVVLLFDARDSAYVSPAPGRRHAVDLAVDAGTEIFTALFDRGDLTGIAAFDTVPCWLATSAGDDHSERARQLFARHPALASLPPELKDVEGSYVDPLRHVLRQLPVEAQVMLFSPLCDDYTVEVARRLDLMGHLVTIISPDPTNDRTPGQRLARVERSMRIASLREREIQVVDWNVDEMLGLELERAKQRWAV
ncbi:DUF58 domain-containing protein [Natronoglomus mannanivorans]|uniref:DUF58 domain-containing protein n=1 Tax=Natronoglomus mannanivorans TaxID=2979990 RepID=UPI00308339E3